MKKKRDKTLHIRCGQNLLDAIQELKRDGQSDADIVVKAITEYYRVNYRLGTFNQELFNSLQEDTKTISITKKLQGK